MNRTVNKTKVSFYLKKTCRVKGRMKGWMKGWMNEWMDEWDYL